MKRSYMIIAPLVVGVGVLFCSGVAVLAYNAWYFDWLNVSHTYVCAKYEGMEFARFRYGEYGKFSTPSESQGVRSQVAQIYIRSRVTGRTFFLPDMTVDEVSEVTGLSLREKKPLFIDGEDVYVIGFNSFAFRNGRLAGFYSNPDPYSPWSFEIGPTKDGSFVTFPASTEEVHRLFGKPLGYKRYKAGGI